MNFTRRETLKLAGLGALALVTVSAAQAATTHEVTIQGFAFAPNQLTIAAGDTVRFTNADGAPHTATGAAFDTGRLNKNASAEVTLAESGSYDYACRFHPNMKGSITVS